MTAPFGSLLHLLFFILVMIQACVSDSINSDGGCLEAVALGRGFQPNTSGVEILNSYQGIPCDI
jgi:hypothetical protein